MPTGVRGLVGHHDEVVRVATTKVVRARASLQVQEVAYKVGFTCERVQFMSKCPRPHIHNPPVKGWEAGIRGSALTLGQAVHIGSV